MAVSITRGCNDSGRDTFFEWINQRWEESRVAILAVLVAFSVILPLFSITEDKINGNFPSIGSDSIEREVDRVLETFRSEKVRQDSLEGYFNALFAHRAIQAQCRLLHIRMPMVFVDARHACLRLEESSSFRENEFVNRYHYVISPQRFAELAREYYEAHPERKGSSTGIAPIITVWHWEKLLQSYLTAMGWSLVLYLLRFRSLNCLEIAVETANPRFVMALIVWPYFVWFYPGDPRDRFRRTMQWMGYFLGLTISCFAGGVKAGGPEKRTKDDEMPPIAWVVSGYASAVMDGSNPHIHQGNTRLIVDGAKDGWSGRVEFDLTQSAMLGPDHQWLRHIWLTRKFGEEVDVMAGRFFPASGWTTPPPFSLKTVNYPTADPGRGSGYGVQVHYQYSPEVAVYGAVTGLTGQSFDRAEAFSGVEGHLRLEYQWSPSLSFALTGQHRHDAQWASGEFHLIHDGLTMDGVVYGGDMQGESFVSGYILGAYRPLQWLELHAQFDHSVSGSQRVTEGIRLFIGPEDKGLSFTIDHVDRLNEPANDGEWQLRAQARF